MSDVAGKTMGAGVNSLDRQPEIVVTHPGAPA
jgi:hypothetical protein